MHPVMLEAFQDELEKIAVKAGVVRAIQNKGLNVPGVAGHVARPVVPWPEQRQDKLLHYLMKRESRGLSSQPQAAIRPPTRPVAGGTVAGRPSQLPAPAAPAPAPTAPTSAPVGASPSPVPPATPPGPARTPTVAPATPTPSEMAAARKRVQPYFETPSPKKAKELQRAAAKRAAGTPAPTGTVPKPSGWLPTAVGAGLVGATTLGTMGSQAFGSDP